MAASLKIILAGALAVAAFLPACVFAQTAVLTRSYNDNRTGANTSESILTPDKVAAHGLERMRLPLPGEVPLDDDRMEAQPLYVPGLTMSDGKPHNVIFACTMGNSVFRLRRRHGPRDRALPRVARATRALIEHDGHG